VRLAKFLRKLLRETERDGESTRRSDRQNASIARAKLDQEVRRRVRDAHCWITLRALNCARCHRRQGHQQRGQKCSVRQVNMTISLAFLAPDLVRAAVEGRLPRGVGVERLRDAPSEWSGQFEVLGLNPQ